MTELPERAARAFERHEAFERADGGYEVTTTRFDGWVTAAETDGWEHEYTIEVRAPMLSSVVDEYVGPAVEDGWFETYELRLEDAPMAVRENVELEACRVFEEDGEAVAVFVFRWGNADRAAAIAKAIAEFVEGTYMEGVIPGYRYGPPVSELLSRASHDDGDGERGPMPL